MFGVLQKPHVLVLGLGESGLAMARWCGLNGCRVRVADTREAPANLAFLQAELTTAQFVGGPFAESLLDDIGLVAISPGLSPLEADTKALLDAAQARGIPVWGEIELFAQALGYLEATSGYAPRVLAITGTNGKTTTTALTGRLIERAGKTVGVAGNISPSALDKLSACIASATLPDVWVLELSSFQLEYTFSLAPHAATVLNVTQDHLDWHGSMEAYAAAKARIFGPAGKGCVQVLNRQDKLTLDMARPGATLVTFGTDLPEAAGSYGVLRDGGMPWLTLAEPDVEGEPEQKPRRRKKDEVVEQAVPVRHKRLMPADALHIRGLHNATNAMAALALCRAIDLPLNALLHGLREYRGEPHRVEWVATIDEVEYFDDSKGTNVGATVAALNGLDKRVVLIAGGEGKGQDFSPLAAPVTQYARAVVLIGKDADAIREALAATGTQIVDAATLEEAVQKSAGLAESGDVVLLSPACASLDMFRNYVHRAQVFRGAVEELALSRGIMP
ncbi:UDP-N-acetylmuramoyl-L-alanine--D-glutamate ligase [Cupriavidus sp.]|uniref:UDP-N-acetylmuramoyl-L-alanine--D-glutamate ligase n=1 Tax=Cupriavidus sp. TaxID=1873897 RepID=UPI0025C02ED9|nr:UDP-N-acetylmuramoyl-L-alanine--D-glutamate ligase [Cupriavidus sp.]MCA3186900.1 UDP-N-acetylmuramoyl-L-alanine--D-glutamate ligase [Cupriavidus sp.]MCA3189987.1 UDP-N-acetylmuramoyl-L-alanine--D-glutamate ligase [Cupriavidus sp.]MCA3196886.1 UDP-N-acetylmuramoyl-L-alanine--D-glutamate ligase [Cupriavidus sp.]MCA3204385.1 UDP-N-acetylmuramoyl-L-alanine--D-glutamate ligase [Cupriavidus sp.]MCA3207952.1 UDP-N-acetylmuramoyl-L-alanine--D-glutamate ligase [Cupriavidus sp.]